MIELYDKQAKFFESRKKIVMFVGGVRSGKTFVGCLKDIRIAGENRGARGLVIAPTYTMLRDVILETFREQLDYLGYGYRMFESPGRMKIEFPQWGSEILLRSADRPHSLYGLTVDWVHIDEAAICSRRAFEVAQARILKETPKVKRRIGQILITTTPNGHNWVYDLFTTAETDKDVEAITAYTIENPIIDPAEIERARRMMDERYFRQQFYASFENWAGLVYEEFDPTVHAAKSIPYNPELPVYIGMDFGWNDPTAILWYQYDPATETWYLIKEFVRSHITPRTIAKILKGEVIHLPEGEFQAPCGLDEVEAIVSGLEMKQRRQEANGLSMRDILIQEGIPRYKIIIRHHNTFESIMSVRAKLRNAEGEVKLYVDKDCKRYIRDKLGWHYPEKDGEVQGELPDNSVENHKFSHTNDAERYLINTITPIKSRAEWII